MKDVSCVNDGTSQMSVNKIQDFMDDPVLFQYCEDNEVKSLNLTFSLEIQSEHKVVTSLQTFIALTVNKVE